MKKEESSPSDDDAFRTGDGQGGVGGEEMVHDMDAGKPLETSLSWKHVMRSLRDNSTADDDDDDAEDENAQGPQLVFTPMTVLTSLLLYWLTLSPILTSRAFRSRQQHSKSGSTSASQLQQKQQSKETKKANSKSLTPRKLQQDDGDDDDDDVDVGDPFDEENPTRSLRRPLYPETAPAYGGSGNFAFSGKDDDASSRSDSLGDDNDQERRAPKKTSGKGDAYAAAGGAASTTEGRMVVIKAVDPLKETVTLKVTLDDDATSSGCRNELHEGEADEVFDLIGLHKEGLQALPESVRYVVCVKAEASRRTIPMGIQSLKNFGDDVVLLLDHGVLLEETAYAILCSKSFAIIRVVGGGKFNNLESSGASQAERELSAQRIDRVSLLKTLIFCLTLVFLVWAQDQFDVAGWSGILSIISAVMLREEIGSKTHANLMREYVIGHIDVVTRTDNTAMIYAVIIPVLLVLCEWFDRIGVLTLLPMMLIIFVAIEQVLASYYWDTPSSVGRWMRLVRTLFVPFIGAVAGFIVYSLALLGFLVLFLPTLFILSYCGKNKLGGGDDDDLGLSTAASPRSSGRVESSSSKDSNDSSRRWWARSLMVLALGVMGGLLDTLLTLETLYGGSLFNGYNYPYSLMVIKGFIAAVGGFLFGILIHSRFQSSEAIIHPRLSLYNKLVERELAWNGPCHYESTGVESAHYYLMGRPTAASRLVYCHDRQSKPDLDAGKHIWWGGPLRGTKNKNSGLELV